MTDTPELSRLLDVRQVEGKAARILANAEERAALAKRFDLVRIDSLSADLDLTRDDRVVEARGVLKAQFIQSCAVSAEDIAVTVDEPVYIRFIPETETQPGADDEIEIDAEELDEIPYAGHHFDLGEAVAQSLGLAIDPYLTGPNADAARKAAGIGAPEDQGPFAALKGLADRSQ
ncbi:DUF177 domain-containing protein [Novosphingobium colocasiae]|uniref:YceD family protein n=1 Tax=Novosphingobium colocasiae TaxID=1256513 RepID=UPI0035AEFEC7